MFHPAWPLTNGEPYRPVMRRRDALRWLALAAPLGASGCTSSLPGPADGTSDGGPASEGGGEPPCDEHVYRATTTDEDAAFPWDLQVRNVGLSVYPVTIEITDRSGGTPEAVVSCAATAEQHSRLAFDLSPERQYRVRATLNRPEDPETASTTVSGAQVNRTDAALEVTVDRDEGFTIRHVHVDSGVAVTPTP